MSTQKAFQAILTKFRKYSFSEKHKGEQFERLMQSYLQTDPKYTSLFANVWLWSEFFGRRDFGGSDTGIDLVAKTVDGDFWAVQCKCYAETAVIDKPSVDSFLSTSSRKFKDEEQKTVSFSHRLWISTTNHWGTNAEEAIQNQHPPVSRINLYDLQEAPVDWAKLEKGLVGEESRTAKKFLREHQTTAVLKTSEHFKTADRGKLIMACGTGKTFTALKIAERETQREGLVLFLVPSIALLGQTLREWYAEANEPIKAICICSDAAVSKKTTKNEDSDGSSVVDLALPASTNVPDIVKQFQHAQTTDKLGMTVVFSTYQSIEVIAKAQAQLQKASDGTLGIFDLIICDEAHRTTGVTQAGEDSSAFMKVHDNEFITAKKRLYMTATPRLFNDDSKSRAAQYDALLCSMDDVTLYGEEIYRIGFGEAVAKGLLADYKVLILTMSESDVPALIQKIIANPNNEINTDDASKLVGCINALSKRILGDAGILKDSDPEPMRRAVAFCQNIKVSKKIATAFNDTRTAYTETMPEEITSNLVSVTAEHVDGAMSAPNRDEKLAWLKADTDEKECRVLTNVRCLSEGVDVPSLDAVLFMTARNSQVDVVQSVGRVMRLSPGKKYGYIIIPVVIPAQASAEKALDDNERYQVVWTVLNALRAHDDRFNAIVNKIELNKHRPEQILIGQIDNRDTGEGQSQNTGTSAAASNIANQMSIQFEQLQGVVFARMVEKVGDRRYWEQWAKDVAQIAERYMERINRLIRDEKSHSKAFAKFLSGLQQNINPSIAQGEAVEMLSQHVITKPVFEALFEGYSFVKNNPISVSMQIMLDLLEDQSLDNDNETLQRFYESVRSRAAGIDNAAGKQRIIVELYDKFFKSAFPKMVEKLGIVYTPVEVVDFIIYSVNDILKKEFNRSLSDENIHVLDPFTGTGTFMTRLLQSGLIGAKDLERKYTQELHANEIVLLAYYIAAVNIENSYHDLLDATSYQPFEGICLTDTFQLGEKGNRDELFSDTFPQNSARVEAQKKAPLRVIIGNPPYSVGQTSANDNAQNQSYPGLDNRIAKTYVAATDATNKNSLYDSYIKAFRWSSDRLDPERGGIIAFVSNGAWIDGNATSGFRKCLEQEFSSIYVFNLRGNQRTSGELSRKEGGKIFGSGSRTPISVTFLVKNPAVTKSEATIYYHDIGDYLSREDKLNIVSDFKSIGSAKMVWQTLLPNEHGDWLNQRDDVFGTFIPMGDKDNKQANAFFVPFYSNGVKTQRDAWCYNSSRDKLTLNISRSIDHYNEQRETFLVAKRKNFDAKVKEVLSYDSTKLSWTRALEWDAEKGKVHVLSKQSVVESVYRPFFKQHLYFSRSLNEMVYQIPKLFPNSNLENRVICVSAAGGNKDFSVLIANAIPDLHFNGDTQCFPLYFYEEQNEDAPGLFDKPDETKFVRRDGVSNFILDQAKKAYGPQVNKEDIFYYVYGFLHNPGYRTLFSSDLKKMLPRLFLVEEPKDFWAFSKAGRELAGLHIGYESVSPASSVTVKGAEDGYFSIEKMRYPSKDNKSVIHYNSKITIENIPTEAYEYVVNGKSAIEWIMERYQITVHKDSGIRNDPNDWAVEVGNPRYILDLLLSVINVSLQTVQVVQALPTLKIQAAE